MAESASVFYAGKTVLVTGHTGFKGSWCTIWLHQLGAETLGFALPPATTPSLYELASVADEQKKKIAPSDLQPHVMIFSNGDLTSFELTLEREGSDQTVTLLPDRQGKIKVKVPKDHVT